MSFCPLVGALVAFIHCFVHLTSQNDFVLDFIMCCRCRCPKITWTLINLLQTRAQKHNTDGAVHEQASIGKPHILTQTKLRNGEAPARIMCNCLSLKKELL